jgi:hypothetical protein
MADLLEFNHRTGTLVMDVRDKRAQDLLWQYAMRAKMLDPVFSAELRTALLNAGYLPPPPDLGAMFQMLQDIAFLPDGALGTTRQPVPPYEVDLIPIAINGLQNTLALMKAAEVSKTRGDGNI